MSIQQSLEYKTQRKYFPNFPNTLRTYCPFYMQQNEFKQKKLTVGLERQLSSYMQLQLLQRTQVLFPALKAHNHLNSSSKGSNIHFDLCGRQTCSGCPNIHIAKHLNMENKSIFQKKRILKRSNDQVGWWYGLVVKFLLSRHKALCVMKKTKNQKNMHIQNLKHN